MLNIEESTCSLQGCLADKAYAIVDVKTKKVHRISFSSSLLQHIIDSTNSPYVVKEITFRLGKKLEPNEVSSTGIYALVKSKNDWTLRISLFKNIANYLCDFDTRYLRECIILKIN
jgi:hypothetical protein